jgi:hypothetical protein
VRIVATAVRQVLDLPAKAANLFLQSVNAKEDFSPAIIDPCCGLIVDWQSRPVDQFVNALTRRVGVVFKS